MHQFPGVKTRWEDGQGGSADARSKAVYCPRRLRRSLQNRLDGLPQVAKLLARNCDLHLARVDGEAEVLDDLRRLGDRLLVDKPSKAHKHRHQLLGVVCSLLLDETSTIQSSK